MKELFMLHPHEVHVWTYSIEPDDKLVEKYQPILSSDELEKAASFYTKPLKDKFIVARGTLRYLLSYYLNLSPQTIVFNYTSYGKPFITNQNTISLEFNLSHTHHLAACAFTIGAPIGVDIEFIKPFESMQDIAYSFFSEAEYKKLMMVSPSLRTLSFYTLWTRKESFIKAIGQGLSYPLADFEVSILQHEKPQLIHIQQSPYLASLWDMRSFDIHTAYIGALATQQPIHTFRSYHWNHEKNHLDNHMQKSYKRYSHE